MSGAADWPQPDFQNDDDTDGSSIFEEEISNYDRSHGNVPNRIPEPPENEETWANVGSAEISVC